MKRMEEEKERSRASDCAAPLLILVLFNLLLLSYR